MVVVRADGGVVERTGADVPTSLVDGQGGLVDAALDRKFEIANRPMLNPEPEPIRGSRLRR